MTIRNFESALGSGRVSAQDFFRRATRRLNAAEGTSPSGTAEGAERYSRASVRRSGDAFAAPFPIERQPAAPRTPDLGRLGPTPNETLPRAPQPYQLGPMPAEPPAPAAPSGVYLPIHPADSAGSPSRPPVLTLPEPVSSAPGGTVEGSEPSPTPVARQPWPVMRMPAVVG